MVNVFAFILDLLFYKVFWIYPKEERINTSENIIDLTIVNILI